MEIRFSGHPQVRASDPGAIEIVAGDEWADRSRAIGHAPRYDPDALLSLRGRVRATLTVAGADPFIFEVTIAPAFGRGTPLLLRREPAAARLLGLSASAGAADIPRHLIALLRAPGAEAILGLEAIAGVAPPPGLFALVGMPIGHQGDLGPRALDMLMGVDLILAEDTRIAREALGWRGVRTPIRSCYAQTEALRAAELGEWLAAGQRIAFISDAGMPAVSDPGAVLVQAALAAGAMVTAIPGPSAVPLAFALSGFGGGGFAFLGFPPRKGTERHRHLTQATTSNVPVLLFEAPGRIATLLADLAALAPDRKAALCRDLTKMSETVHRGTLSDLAEQLGAVDDVRGEYVLVIDAASLNDDDAEAPADSLPIEAFVEALVAEGCPTAPIVAALRQSGYDRRTAYDLVQRLKVGGKA